MFAESGATMTPQPDASILVSGVVPVTDVYIITVAIPDFVDPTLPVTGIRLEAIEHPSLPIGGPGRGPLGNFILTELSVFAADPTVMSGYVSHQFPTEAGKEYELTFASRRTGDNSIISWWTGEGDARDFKDGNHGVLRNGAGFGQGMVGRAFRFNGGLGEMVEVADAPNLDLLDNFTIEFWARPDQLQDPFADILRKEDVNNFNGYGLEMTGAPFNHQYYFGWKNQASPSPAFECWTKMPFQVLPNAWRHVAVTKRGGTRQVFLNGQLVAAATCSEQAAITPNNAALQIGSWNYIAQKRAWRGLLDELTFFSRVLQPAEIQAIYLAGPQGKCGMPNSPLPCSVTGFIESEGAIGNFSANATWAQNSFRFVPRTNNSSITFWAESPEVWLDTFVLRETGNQYYLPEEALGLLNGERALGDWTLELIDAKTGAIVPLPEVVRWKLDLTFADPVVRADTLTPGITWNVTSPSINPRNIIQPGRIVTNQVHYFRVDTCPDTTFVDLFLLGLTNSGRLELLADQSGLPTGLETDDYLPIRNFINVNGNFGARFRITTNTPAPAPLIPGKPIFVAVRGYFITTNTNTFSLRFQRNGTCVMPPPMPLRQNQSVESFLASAETEMESASEGELYSVEVAAGAESISFAAQSSGDISFIVQKGAPPTRQSYSHAANRAGNGESLTITTVGGLTPGTWYVRVLNNAPEPVTYSLVASGDVESGNGPRLTAATENGQIVLTWSGEAGEAYEVLSSTDLVSWNILDTVESNGAAASRYTLPATLSYEFFQLRRVEP